MMTPDPKLLAALRDAHARELRAAQLYRLLAGAQKDDRQRDIFYRLAQAEQRHADMFAERIAANGGMVPTTAAAVRPLDRFLARFLGTDAMLRRMEAEEERNIADFETRAGDLEGDPVTRSLFLEVEREEQAHAKLLATLVTPNEPSTRLEAILKGEKWHVSTGSWIGDAIYGVNDGLGAVFGIVSGMAGATGGGRDTQIVIAAGMLGLLASALSMGASAYLAAKAEREVYAAEIGREKKEIEESPEHEKEELALIYELKGFPEEESRRMAENLSRRPEQFLKTMAQEELGLSIRHFPNPWVSLASASISTAVGALIPVLPFFFVSGVTGVIISAVVSTLAHFAVGAAKSLVTARHWIASGMEMTVVGVLMGIITYLMGAAFHVG
jgi:VIT1/CCC1 family predicted Fe2+/Mn2+ transporter/rubrerythrin